MDDPTGYNFLSTPGPDSNVKSTDKIQGSDLQNVFAYCRPCDHGFRVSLISENLKTPVCNCKPSCSSVKGLRHKMREGEKGWFGYSDGPVPVTGQCEFIPPGE